MIYHLFNANVVHHTPGMIERILQYASQTNYGGVNEHFFLLTTYTKVSYLTINDVNYVIYEEIFKNNRFVNYIFLSNSFNYLNSLFKISKKDTLIIHDTSSLFGRSHLFWLFLFLRGKNFCKKVSIVNWGVPDGTLKDKSGIIYRILFAIKKNVLNNFRFVITMSSDDEEKIKKQYELKNVITANYVKDAYNEYKSGIKKTNIENQTTKIMISHSAFEQHNHIQTFKLLERFKDENIQIICPLSYGNPDYVKRVIKEGKRIFGKKFIYFQDLIPRDDYNNLLASLNIFIANASIQTGLYVIHFGLCTGLKMYLRDNNYNSIKLLGFKTNNVRELGTISFSEFKSQNEMNWLEHNDKRAKEIFSADEKIKIWKNIYNYNPKTK